MTTLFAREGDTLDLLLWREAGLTPQALEAVLTANPGLAAIGATLPPRTPVILPAPLTSPATPAPRPVVQLWDL